MTPSKSNYSTESFSPFAKNMKSVAIGVLIFGGIIAAPIVWSSNGKPTTLIFVASRAIEIIVWFYLSAILFLFYQRTQLREYILHTHTYWLAGVVAYPITYLLNGILLLFGNAIQTNLYTFFGFVIPATWLILLLVGKAFRQRRTKQLETETQNNLTIWKHLLDMELKSIALLQFPSNR
jgi:hypothetical protein